MCICRKQNKRKCYRKTQLKTDDIFAGPLKQSWDKLRQAVLAWLSVSELFVRLLEHPSINKASLIYPRIICTKITCISILYFTIKPDDFYFLETHRAQKECFLKVFGDVFFFFFISIAQCCYYYIIIRKAKRTIDLICFTSTMCPLIQRSHLQAPNGTGQKTDR